MKLCAALFVLYFIYCSGEIQTRYNGKRTYFSGSTHITDGFKYKSRKPEVNFESPRKVYGSYLPKRTKIQNVDKSIKITSSPIIVKNKNVSNQSVNYYKLKVHPPKTLSLDVGKHLVKVSSALHSNHLDIKSKDGGYEISSSPKFSHVIEIHPKNDLNASENTKMTYPLENIDEVLPQKLDKDSMTVNNRSNATEPCVKAPSQINSEEIIPQHPASDEIKANSFSTEMFPKPVGDKFFESSESTTPDPNSGIMLESMIRVENTSLEILTESDKLSFKDELEGSGEEFSSAEGGDKNSTKGGRILSFFSERNNDSLVCTTPKGENGHCRRISQCLLSDALNNFNIFLQQLCLIRGAMVGVCCPDNPVIEITDHDENSTDTKEATEIIQPPEGCGLNTKTRIVGGSISGKHEWSWMVALLRRDRFYCGGVIINNWYILTAAHCVMGMNVKELSVRLGEYDFNAENKHKEDISVAEIKRHAQFVTVTFQHDIALLKLKRSIRYSKFVGSICLPSDKARDYSDVQGTVVGWGTVSFGGAASPVLRQVTIPVWKNEDCDRTYLLESISEAFMCAGSPEKGEDACQGDSGGPLMTLNEQGRWEVIGVVSWGRRCGDPTYPGVYTRVTTYLDWIRQNID